MQLILNHAFTISSLGTQVYEDFISGRILVYENFTRDIVIKGIINNNPLNNDLIGRIFIYVPVTQDYSERVLIATKLIYGGKHGVYIPFPFNNITANQRLIISIVMRNYITPLTLEFYNIEYAVISPFPYDITIPGTANSGDIVGVVDTTGISSPSFNITSGNEDLDLDSTPPYTINDEGHVIIGDIDDIPFGNSSIHVSISDNNDPNFNVDGDINITR